MQYKSIELELCWLQGFRSHFQNLSEDTNPFPIGSAEAHLWSEGWWECALNENGIVDVYLQEEQAAACVA